MGEVPYAGIARSDDIVAAAADDCDASSCFFCTGPETD